MDSARIALAALATVGSGIVLGLAVNPTLRPMPGTDWRERYRAMAPPAAPAPQAGVSYFGDGSTAWVFGRSPPRFSDRMPPLRLPAWHEPPESRTPPLPPDLPRESFDAEASAAERAAAQAVVADALIRSAVAEPGAADRPSPAADEPAQVDEAGISPAQDPLP